MALSNSFDFTLTRDTCIQEALQQLGVIGAGETPSSADYTDCAVTLNLMLKAWQNKEVAQNLIRRFYVFLNDDQREYTLSTTAANSAPSCYNFYTDTLAADYVDGGTTLTVTTGTGAADGDELIVVPDSGVNGVSDVESGGTTTTLVVPDINIDAESGKRYYAFTSRVARPVNIMYAERHLQPTSNGEDNVINTVSHQVKIGERRDWADLSAKHTEGATNMVWFNEGGNTGDWNDATLHVWPEPTGAQGEYLEIWGQYTIDDLDASTNNFNLPSRWYLAVAFNLAKWVASKYGVSPQKKNYIAALAQESLDDAEMAETDNQFQLMPDPHWRR